MSRRLPMSLCMAGVVLLTGCYTKLAVNFGNGTGEKIRVNSAYTGQDVQIAPNKSKKIPHCSGDLIVTSSTSEKFSFPNVSLLGHDMDDSYLDKRVSIFGPGYMTLNVVLETNMELHVLPPGKKGLAADVKQPSGYPKRGERTSQ
ncbi:MAG: hypothetical protein NTX27_03600 [Verrucomicrobia bacterium]|nr:hypothetical protein [Verrucomicrobiota bacterium]